MKHKPDILSFLLSAVLVLLLSAVTGEELRSQTPQEFFVGGANMYINGETEKARSFVDKGLSNYPDDKKLLALKKAIEEEKKDQNQNQNKENKDQKDNQKNDQNQNQEQKGAVSKEDAQRLLDALANDEKKVQEKVKEAKAAKAKVRTIINW